MNLNSNLFLDLLTSITPGGIAKFMLITIAFMYIFFAFAVWRQVNLMIQSIKLGASPLFNLIGIFHLFLAIGVFILGLIML